MLMSWEKIGGGGLNPPWLLPGIVDGPVSGRWHGLTVGWGR